MFVGIGAAELSVDTSSLLIGTIAFILLGPIVLRVARRRFDIFEPIVIFSATFTAMFVLRPVAMLANAEFDFLWSPGVDLRGTFDEMLLLVLIGSAAFMVGYHLPLGRRLAAVVPKPPSDWRSDRVIVLCIGASLLGLILFALFLIQAGGLSAVDLILRGRSLGTERVLREGSSYFVLAPLILVGASLVTFAVGLRLRKPTVLMLALALAVLVMIVWGSFGSRIAIGPLVLAMAVCVYLYRDARPRAITVLAFVALMMFASTVIATERFSDIRGEKSRVEVAVEVLLNPASIIAPVLTGPDNTIAPALAAGLTIVPDEVPHTYGLSTFRDFLIRPVPRNLWPEKPLPPREEVIATMAPAAYQAHIANPEFSNLFVFYIDFGLLGGLALALYGIIGRTLYEWFRLHKTETAAQVIFALALPMIVIACRDSTVDAFTLALLNVGPAWLVFRLSQVRRREVAGSSRVRPSPAG